MTKEQMNVWANIQTSVTEAGYETNGLTLEQIANAIADNLDTAEVDRLIYFLAIEKDKKIEAETIIH